MKYQMLDDEKVKALLTAKNTTETSAQELKLDNEIVEVSNLPSAFKIYPVNSLLVRGLNVGEVKLLNKNLGNVSLDLLAKLYSNVISGIAVEDLLPIDFKMLMFLIAQVTDPLFNINTFTDCVACGKHFPKTLTLEDMDFDDLDEPQIVVNDLTFNQIRIKDILFSTYLKTTLGDQLFSEYDSVLLSLSLSLNPEIANTKNVDLFLEAYNKLSKLPSKPYSKLLDDVNSKLILDIAPLSLQCPACKVEFKSQLNLDFARIYL